MTTAVLPSDRTVLRTDARREALLELLAQLDTLNYDFVTTTPASHARVLERFGRERAKDLRDVLGWNLPFASEVIPHSIFGALKQAGSLVDRGDGLFHSIFRVSRVHGALFLHSSFPTTNKDAVFLGPDSYRFADLILARLGGSLVHARVLDYGAGAGVGGVTATAGRRCVHLTLADINPHALFLASINAEFAGLDFSTAQVGRPAEIDGKFDLIVMHPPFMMDEGQRAYRDGGDLFGGQLAIDWVCDGAHMLLPGGRLILHTGSSIVNGCDVLRDTLRERLPALGLRFEYSELDPDIFGDELSSQAYAAVDRIAAIGLVLTRLTDSDTGGQVRNSVARAGADRSLETTL